MSAQLGHDTRVVGWYHSHPHITVLPSHVGEKYGITVSHRVFSTVVVVIVVVVVVVVVAAAVVVVASAATAAAAAEAA